MRERGEPVPNPERNSSLIRAGLFVVCLAGLAADGPPTAPERIAIPGIENAFRLSPRLFSGGDPHGPESFAALRALGVRAIISVDGAAPDVATARTFGLRYVHLPIGYDGLPRDQAVRLVRAIRELPGPVFVHCHHGKHRGPAAAAVCGQTIEGWTVPQAIAWLERAGTAPEYSGLYASVREFQAPSAQELEHFSGALPEETPPQALVERMVQIDATWDRLKLAQKSGFQANATHPDLDPAHESLQIVEHFREAARLAESEARGADFLARLANAEADATDLHESLIASRPQPTSESLKRSEDAFTRLGKRCSGCHAASRDH